MERTRNPLGYLEDLLEEEKQGNEFFGHVDFWRFFEFIDVTKIYNTKSIEYRNVKLIVYEVFFYIIYIFMLTFYISHHIGNDGMNLEAREQQSRYWAACSGGKCKIDDVRDGDSLLLFMKESLLPRLFSDRDLYFPLTKMGGSTGVWTLSGTPNEPGASIYTLNDKSKPWIPRYAGKGKNIILLGNTRVRQLRVKKNGGCKIKKEFETIQVGTTGTDLEPIACYPPFEEELESKLKYDPRHTPSAVVRYFSHSLERSDLTKDRQNASMTMVHGRHGDYPGEGFYFDIPLTRRKTEGQHSSVVDAETVLNELQNWNYFDKKTRAIVIENSVVNPNTNIIVSNRLVFEFSAYGQVTIQRDHFAVRATLLSMSLIATDEKAFFMFLVVFCACFELYFISCLWFLWKNGSNYFFYAWNLLDIVIVILFWCYLGYRLDTFITALNETAFLPEMLGMPDFFFSFSKLKDSIVAADGILAFIGLLSWIRVLKFFTLLDRFRLLIRAIEKTLMDLVVFASLLGIIVFGFSIAFYVGFYSSEENPEFQSIFSSMCTLFFMLAKGVSLQFLFSTGHWLPQVLFITYLIVVYFLLVNMFMAIVNDTYTLITFAAQAKNTKQFGNDSITWCFFVSYGAKLKGDIFISGDELDEDRGMLSEQFIEVSALPEVLQKSWAVKRDQIRQLVNSKVESMGHSADIQKLKTEFDDFDKKGVISRIQIQRLLDEDENLENVLGTSKAIDVIRRFSTPEFRHSNEEVFDEVTILQQNVFTKLEEFDGADSKLEFGCIDTLKLVNTGLHEALTDIQNQWRNELTFVLESTNSLATLLTDMTRKMEKIQQNHTTIVHEAGLQQVVNTNKEEEEKRTKDEEKRKNKE